MKSTFRCWRVSARICLSKFPMPLPHEAVRPFIRILAAIGNTKLSRETMGALVKLAAEDEVLRAGLAQRSDLTPAVLPGKLLPLVDDETKKSAAQRHHRGVPLQGTARPDCPAEGVARDVRRSPGQPGRRQPVARSRALGGDTTDELMILLLAGWALSITRSNCWAPGPHRALKSLKDAVS